MKQFNQTDDTKRKVILIGTKQQDLKFPYYLTLLLNFYLNIQVIFPSAKS